MDINKVQVFLVVAETGSFSKAAESLGYTQAGVSYVIKSLEEELQLQLVERNYNGIKLSSHGRALYPAFSRMFDSYKSFDASIQTRREYNGGTLYIGTFDSPSARWFGDALQREREKNPHIRYEITVGNPHQLNEWLESGKVDLAISERVLASRGFIWRDITDDPYFAVLPRDKEHEVPCTFESFNKETMYVADYGDDWNSVMTLKHLGIKPQVMPDRISNSLIVKNVAMGNGSTIMPACMLCDTSLLQIGSTYFPKIVKMEGGLRRVIGAQYLESNQNNELLRGFITTLTEVVRDDVTWAKLTSKDIWTYEDELEAFEYAKQKR